MKEINMTKAISCMPDKFITMEMVELAATEHRPELVNYLPENTTVQRNFPIESTDHHRSFSSDVLV